MSNIRSIYLGFDPNADVSDRRSVFHAEEGELRVQVQLTTGGSVLVVTRHTGSGSKMEERLAAVSAAISISGAEDHDAARREVDRAVEDSSWITSSVDIDGKRHSIEALQLLSGGWAGSTHYQGAEVAIGTKNMEIGDVILATLEPSDVEGIR